MDQINQLSQSIECAQKCKFEMWSFRTGAVLSQDCPSKCSVNDIAGHIPKLEGARTSSRVARELYADNADIKNLNSNLAQVTKVCEEAKQAGVAVQCW